MLDYNFLIINSINTIFISFILNFPSYGFDAIDRTFGGNNIINGLFYIFIIYFIYIGLIYLGRLIYKKFKLKKEGYGNIYLLSFVGIVFPIISLISAILLGMREKKLSRVIKIFSIGFILYSIVGFILYKYYDFNWGILLQYIFDFD